MSDVVSAERESADLGAIAPDGGIYVLGFWDQASIVSAAQTELEAINTLDDVINLYSNTIITPTSPAIVDVFQAVQDSITADELPYEDAAGFFNWLRYTKGEPTISVEDAQGGQINAWLVEYITQVLHLPVPGAPAPGPVELPSPSIGQTTVAKGAREVTPAPVAAPTLSPEQATAIQNAIGVAAADILKVQAAVIDAMLPNLEPGQVPQALNQLNTAANALENQMATVMKSLDADQSGTLAAQLNGALEALHGLSQEVNILAQDVAMKAESTIGDIVNANTAEIATLSGAVATLVGTAIPDLAQGLEGTTAALGRLDTEVNNEIKPQLSSVTQTTDNLTNELSGTDKECLDQLCDALNNVTSPIKEGGATPSLLRKLGGLLGGFFAAEGIMALVTTFETLLNAPAVYSAVAQDMPTMATWAEQAAHVIATDLSWSGGLKAGG